MPAEGAPVGLALRRLRNRAHVVNRLVARLRQKVRLPLDTWAGQLSWLEPLTSSCLSFPPRRVYCEVMCGHVTAPGKAWEMSLEQGAAVAEHRACRLRRPGRLRPRARCGPCAPGTLGPVWAQGCGGSASRRLRSLCGVRPQSCPGPMPAASRGARCPLTRAAWATTHALLLQIHHFSFLVFFSLW